MSLGRIALNAEKLIDAEIGKSFKHLKLDGELKFVDLDIDDEDCYRGVESVMLAASNERAPALFELAYGRPVRAEGDPYAEEKIALIEKRGITALWGELDHDNGRRFVRRCMLRRVCDELWVSMMRVPNASERLARQSDEWKDETLARVAAEVMHGFFVARDGDVPDPMLRFDELLKQKEA